MDKFFAFLGKAVLVFLLVGGLAGGGYYLGKSGKLSFGNATPAPEAVTTTDPSQEAITNTPAPTTTATPKSTKTVSAGLGAESGLSFTRYSIQIPEGWTPTHTYTNEGTPVDTLTITNGAYQIKIFQAATGGAMCLYPGDPDFEGPSSRFTMFVELTTVDGITLRRGGTTGGGFTLCQKGTENYGQPTVFGHTSYKTPTAYDVSIVDDMDAITKTLKKV